MGKRIPFKNNTTEKDKIRGTLVRLARGFFFWDGFGANSHPPTQVHCGSVVRFGQALPGYLITAHHLYASLL